LLQSGLTYAWRVIKTRDTVKGISSCRFFRGKFASLTLRHWLGFWMLD
jgi:hypothetical protein